MQTNNPLEPFCDHLSNPNCEGDVLHLHGTFSGNATWPRDCLVLIQLQSVSFYRLWEVLETSEFQT